MARQTGTVASGPLKRLTLEGLGRRPGRLLSRLLESGSDFLKLLSAEAGPNLGEPVLLFFFDVMRDVLDQHDRLGVEALSPARQAGPAAYSRRSR
jgi:hypothetical protein